MDTEGSTIVIVSYKKKKKSRHIRKPRQYTPHTHINMYKCGRATPCLTVHGHPDIYVNRTSIYYIPCMYVCMCHEKICIGSLSISVNEFRVVWQGKKREPDRAVLSNERQFALPVSRVLILILVPYGRKLSNVLFLDHVDLVEPRVFVLLHPDRLAHH